MTSAATRAATARSSTCTCFEPNVVVLAVVAQHDLLRPRRAVARHRRRRRAAGRRRAGVQRRPGGMTAYGTSVGYPPLREWIAEHHGVEPEQVLVTNGSMQADAFLFDALVSAGRRGDRRAADLRPHAAVAAQPRRRRADGRARARRDRRRRARARARRRRRSPSSPTSSPTSRTRPATRCRRAKRERLLELARDARVHDLRGRSLRGAALRGRAAADDALDRTPTRSSTRRRSRRPSAPGSGSATWSGPRS